MKILNLILLMFLLNHSNAQEFVSSTDRIEPTNEDYDNIRINKLSTNYDATKELYQNPSLALDFDPTDID